MFNESKSKPRTRKDWTKSKQFFSFKIYSKRVQDTGIFRASALGKNIKFQNKASKYNRNYYFKVRSYLCNEENWIVWACKPNKTRKFNSGNSNFQTQSVIKSLLKWACKKAPNKHVFQIMVVQIMQKKDCLLSRYRISEIRFILLLGWPRKVKTQKLGVIACRLYLLKPKMKKIS